MTSSQSMRQRIISSARKTGRCKKVKVKDVRNSKATDTKEVKIIGVKKMTMAGTEKEEATHREEE